MKDEGDNRCTQGMTSREMGNKFIIVLMVVLRYNFVSFSS